MIIAVHFTQIFLEFRILTNPIGFDTESSVPIRIWCMASLKLLFRESDYSGLLASTDVTLWRQLLLLTWTCFFLPTASIVPCSRWSSSTDDRSSLFIWPFVRFLWCLSCFSDLSPVSLMFSPVLWLFLQSLFFPSLMVFFCFPRNTLEILVRTLRDYHTVGRYCETLLFE